MTSGRARCGAGSAAAANFDENSPNTRCWLSLLDEPEGGDVPERGACRRCRGRPPSRRAGRTASRRPSRIRPTTCFTGAWRCEVPSHDAAGGGQRGDRLGPHLGGAAPEAAVAGQEVVGDRDICGVCRRGHCASMAPVARISARIAAITESATLAVDAKAKALKAQGEDVIGFGAGEPDFPTPEHIVEAAIAACRDPKYHHYTPAAGLPELREAIAAKTQRDSGFDCSAARSLVTNGGKHAVYNAFAGAAATRATRCSCPRRTGPPTPSRSPWPVACRSCSTPTSRPASASPSSSSRRPARRAPRCCCSCRPTTRAARCTRPRRSRPSAGGPSSTASGWSPTRSTSTSPTATTSSPRCRRSCPSSPTRCVIVNGVAKTYAMTGWRVGWMIGPKDVIAAATNLQSHATSNVANVSQARGPGRRQRRPRGGGR